MERIVLLRPALLAIACSALLVMAVACAAHNSGHQRDPHAAGHQHSFADAQKWAKRFEDTERDAWQQPDRVLAHLDLEPSMVVADIGSATGYFPVRIARLVDAGRVWGVDLEPDMVRYLNARARREGLTNLYSVLGTFDDALLPEPVDRVLMVNTYHHIAERPAYFRRLLPFIREGGSVAIVDFRMGQIPIGPPEERRIEPEQVIHEMREAGFAHRATHELPYQYLLIFDGGSTEPRPQ